MRRFYLLFFLAVAAAPSLVRAQGGPPFITDDPNSWRQAVGDQYWLGGKSQPRLFRIPNPGYRFNYGWGDRIQLKYEIPMAVATDLNNTTRAGLGGSFPGSSGVLIAPQGGRSSLRRNMDFSIGTYPRPTSITRPVPCGGGLWRPGPEYYLPLEMSAKWGPINFNGEVGHWFGNHRVPSRWAAG